jgi:hypothetical protein
MGVSSAVAYFCYKAMYIIQSLFFMLQNVYMNCIEMLDTWILHSCCNKTCIEFCDLAVLICNEQCIKMMQMLPFQLNEPLVLPSFGMVGAAVATALTRYM